MKNSKKLRYPASIFVILVIWIVCMIPIQETPVDDIKFIDKWVHLLMYGGLTVTIWFEYILQHATVAWKRLCLGGILMPILMGIAVELAQAYLTTCRSGDWLDAASNAAGVIIGAGIGRAMMFCKLRI